MTEQGYIKKDLSVTGKEIQFGSILLSSIFLISYIILFYVIHPNKLTFGAVWSVISDNFLLSLLILLVGIVVHELIHGIFAAIYAKKGFKSVKFGVLWKYLAPYCHCSEPLPVHQYVIVVLTPLIFLGIVPFAVSLLTGSMALFVFGFFFTYAAGGDLLIYKKVKDLDHGTLVKDYPDKIGCAIYEKA